MKILLLPAVFLLAQFAVGQNLPIADRILHDYWKAQWIAAPGAAPNEYGVFHFRKTLEINKKPGSFIVHVSADNRYRLFVNGTPVSSGPARSDLANWNFETVDLAPHLRPGKNSIAALVWNAADHKPYAQISYQTGFVLQGDTEAEDVVNTNKSWKVLKNSAYRPLVADRGKIQAYLVTGDGDEVDAAKYPWGWELPQFDDSGWLDAHRLWFPTKPRGLGTDGNWMLVPRTIPAFPENEVRFHKIRGDWPSSVTQLVDAQAAITVPAKTTMTLLFDQAHLVNAYPELITSGGKGAKLTLTYAEALFDKNRKKGNRNEVEGKEIMGIQDRFWPDGGTNRLFRPLWFRTYRYVQLEIVTADAPITIQDFYGKTYGYPFGERANFSSDDPSLGQIWEVGWRTAQLCAGENYFDCPYYEQLQYIGDTRIQALISLYVSGDDRLMRKAIEDFDHSRFPDGLTQSRYPCADMQVIPTYSMFWVSMIHDYWMHRTDDKFIRKFRGGMEAVLRWHEDRLAENGMLGPLEWWNFVDWSWPWNDVEKQGGVPPGVRKGGSSIVSLQFAYTLRQAGDLFEYFGETEKARHYDQLADKITAATYLLCWDAKRGLLADTPEKNIFSDHANYLAVLTDALPLADQQPVLKRVMADTTITKSTFYFRFYLFEALKKIGLGDLYLDQLGDWKDMLQVGLTTFAEEPEPTRSDCHAWSASPNYEFLSLTLGVNPTSPGFHTVRICPKIGALNAVSGTVPHPLGDIEVSLERKPQGVEAVLSLPNGLDGVFEFAGKKWTLTGGVRTIIKTW